MADVWIGGGGWGYFRGPTGRSLEDYARAFRFVEVNTTFYRHPSIPAARRWRRTVPGDFRFSVKAHRDVTHTERMRATRRAIAALTRTVAVADALKADLLVLQTPPDLVLGGKEAAALKDLAAGMAGRVRIALEARAHEARPLPVSVASALRDVGGIDVVDLSKGDAPRVESEILYTRLFGRGEHNAWEFSDAELREIEAKARGHGGDRMVFAFHGVRMYKDAARFLSLERTGSIPPATRRVGIDAVQEVLAPDVRFPATRENLLDRHGWKVVATEGRGNVHAAEFLRRVPGRTIPSMADLVERLRPERGTRRPVL